MEINKGKALRNINNEIAAIESWDELTEMEKKIVPKDLFLKSTDEKPQNEFKEGDFVYRKLNDGSEWISIHKGIDKTDTRGDIISFADITVDGNNHPYKSFDVWPLCSQTDVEIEGLATEDEKQRLLDSIDENGYVWDAKKLEIKRKNRRFKVIGIDWDCFADPSHYNLPIETIIEAEDEDEVVDKLSDKYGWCINSVEEIIPIP